MSQPDRTPSAAQPHELRLTWAFNDPGLVHLARHGSTRTLCDKTAMLAFVSRRSVTCSTCKEDAPRPDLKRDLLLLADETYDEGIAARLREVASRV